MAVAAGAGVLGGIQPKLNSVLAARVGSTLLASTVNFTMALVCVLVMLAIRADTRRLVVGVRRWPVPRWTMLAGLGGATIVLAGATSVGTIGVAIFSVALFSGQIAFGLLVDRSGIGPGGVRPIVAARSWAAVIALVAVGVSQVGRPVGELAPLLVLFVVGAGAAFALQAAANGRNTLALGDPFAPTAVNVVVGLAALLATLAVVAATGGLAAVTWPTEPWLYAGGMLGVTVVLSLSTAAAAIGVFRATIAMLAAQLTTAFVVDWLADGEPPRPAALVGAAMVVVAVVIVGRSTRRAA